jgi:hypothetical protein
MPRVPRRSQWASAVCSHLMDRGHDREAIFADAEGRRAFRGLVGRYRDRFRFRLYHCCLMSNPFFALLQREDPAHVSPLRAGLLRASVHPCHRRYGGNGPAPRGSHNDTLAPGRADA